MKKKIIISVTIICLIAIALSGCATDLAAKKGYYWHPQTIDPSFHDYTVLGKVRVEQNWRGIVGGTFAIQGILIEGYIVETGGVTYSDVLDEALKLYPDADAVIDITFDYRNTRYWFFFSERTEIVTGIAVKYVKEQRNTGNRTGSR